MMDRPERTKKFEAPLERKVEPEEDKNPSTCYVRLDLLKDGTYRVTNDQPLSLAHAAMLAELARDIAIHFHEQAQKVQMAKGKVALPRVDARLQVN